MKLIEFDYATLLKLLSFPNLSPKMARQIRIEILWRHFHVLSQLRSRRGASIEERDALKNGLKLICEQITTLGAE